MLVGVYSKKQEALEYLEKYCFVSLWDHEGALSLRQLQNLRWFIERGPVQFREQSTKGRAKLFMDTFRRWMERPVSFYDGSILDWRHGECTGVVPVKQVGSFRQEDGHPFHYKVKVPGESGKGSTRVLKIQHVELLQ